MTKRIHSVGYFSSYDRGLETLLDIWPKVIEAVPDATLDVAYGWNTFKAFHKNNPQKMKWHWQMVRKFHQYDVTEHGRLSHTDLAKLMESTQVLAYPTSFEEIDCITVKKAQAAKMDVVTSGYAALQESVVKKEPMIKDIAHNPEELEKYTLRLIDALLKPVPEAELQAVKEAVLAKYAWPVIAKQWDEAMR